MQTISLRRMLPFLLINIVVSAVVMLGVLYWWDSRNPQPAGGLASADVPITSIEPGVVELAPTLPPTETPLPATATPTPAPTYHTVEPGESLSAISDIYGVSMQEIMEANGLLNENFIQVGQQLLIPIGGVVAQPEAVDETGAGTATPIGVPPTPIPTVPLTDGEADLVISSFNGVGEITAENILIVNNGTRTVDINGWQVREETGAVYTFGQGATLFGGGAGLQLFTGIGEDTTTRRYWGQSQSIWQSGEIVQIFDAEGTLQITGTVP